MPGNDLIFIGTTGPGGTAGDNTPDPANWLGRARAADSNTLSEIESTLTSTQITTARHILIDTARIGDGANAHALKWILIQTGPAALEAARIESFDDSTGTFKLDRRTTANAVSGDAYAIFAPNNVWPDVTPTQAREGDERFRCIYMRNTHGATITNVRYHLVPLGAGGNDLARINQVSSTATFIERADDTTDIVDSLGQRVVGTGSDGFNLGTSSWLNPPSRGIAFGEDASLINNDGNAIWLRRTVPAGVRFRRSIAYMIVATTDVTGSDPDPLAGAAIMAWDIEGVPEGTVAGDRYGSVGGGIRYTGTVTDSLGEALSGIPVEWRVSSGDVGTVVTDDDPVSGYDTTDSNGLTGATFTIPTTATPGDTSDVELVLPGGEEVGDPS